MCHRLLGANLGDVGLISPGTTPAQATPSDCRAPVLSPLCGQQNARSTISPEVRGAGLQKGLQLLHHGSHVGAIDQSQAQLQSPPGRREVSMQAAQVTLLSEPRCPQAPFLQFLFQTLCAAQPPGTVSSALAPSPSAYLLREASASRRHSTTVDRCRCTALWSDCTSRSNDVRATYLVRVGEAVITRQHPVLPQ